MRGKKEFGDYQTPLAFSSKVCDYLRTVRKLSPATVIEPTCGLGNFIKSSLLFDAERYIGIEINQEYCENCRNELKDSRVTIIHSDFFGFDTRQFNVKEPVLIIGNPPWANNSYLSSIGSDNLPQKANLKGLKGIDALTGASNFDICEYMIMQVVEQFDSSNAVIAMLCKISVARNVFRELNRKGIYFSCCDMVEFDADKVFRINAKACLLYLQLSKEKQERPDCNIFRLEEPAKILSTLSYHNGNLYQDLSDQMDDFEGRCCFEWRQGIKHDCAKVMELDIDGKALINGKKERVDIESDYVFPLIKSSMFKSPVISMSNKRVIVTQKKVREDTRHLEKDVPKTWKYLNDHIELFQSRKSSIYKGAPEFSMFGVGDYSYSKYKVGVSGFYKEPLFSVLYSEEKKPVMTDDTSYFICFSTYENAYVAMLYLNCFRVRDFLRHISFSDAKRPYTKKVLERLDFDKIYHGVTFEELKETESALKLDVYLTRQMVRDFSYIPEMAQGRMRFSSKLD